MSVPLLVNAAAAVTLWLAAAAGAMLVLSRYPAVLRRNVCRLGLAGVPAVLAGAAAMHWVNPAAGLLRGPLEACPAAPSAATPPPERPSLPQDSVPDREPLLLAAARTPWAHSSAPAAQPAATSLPQAPRARGLSVDWRVAGVSAGLAVSGLCAFVLALRLVRLALWRRTWRPAAPAWVSLTRRLARRTGLARPFDVFIAPGLSQPAAAGMLRGVIVLPDRPGQTLGPGLRGALAHELGHLEGRDPLWNVLGQAALALAWWCPPAWWLCRRARVESELAADDRALESGVRPIDLARALARFAETDTRPLPAVISGMACHLTRRIQMILNAKQPHSSRIGSQSRWLLGWAAGLGAAAVVSLPVVGVARADEEGEGERLRPREQRRERVERPEGDAPREQRRRDGERAERERDEPLRIRGERRRDGEGDGEREGALREREGRILSAEEIYAALRALREREGRMDGLRRLLSDGSALREREGRMLADALADLLVGALGEREGRMPRELMEMIRELAMTDAQKQAVQDKLQARQAAVRDWRKDNQAKVRAAEEAMRKIQAELRALRESEQAVARAADEQVMAVFTPEQVAQWEARQAVKRHFHRGGERREPMDFTATQTDHVKTLCVEAVKELVAAGKKPANEAAAAKQEILYRLVKKVYDDVLLPEQQAGMKLPDPPRRGRGEADRGEGRREGEREGGPERRLERRDRGGDEDGEG